MRGYVDLGMNDHQIDDGGTKRGNGNADKCKNRRMKPSFQDTAYTKAAAAIPQAPRRPGPSLPTIAENRSSGAVRQHRLRWSLQSPGDPQRIADRILQKTAADGQRHAGQSGS